MSYSDYLSLKKIKIVSKDKTTIFENSGSNHVRRKQFHQIQKTILLDEDYEIIENQRFNIHVPPIIFPEVKNPKKKAMFSIPRIHVMEYVKNRYEPPFCWTCKIPIDDLTKEIACLVCNSVQPIPETLFELQESMDIDMNEYLDGVYSIDLHDSFKEGDIRELKLGDVDVFDKIEEVREILENENNIKVDEESKNITIENNILFL